jgi:hypothetical protein
MTFPGDWLHGVLPGQPAPAANPTTSQQRLTLMVAWCVRAFGRLSIARSVYAGDFSQ